jgi:type IV secretory pathway VirB4 component
MLGARPVTTVSLQKLPVKTFAGLMETLTRQAGLNFPYEIATSFQIGEQVNWDEKLERMQNRIRISLMSTLHPNQVEEIKQGELYDLRQQIRKGEEKIGMLGFSVTFGGPTPDELKRRRDLILVAMRAMEGLEGVSERHMPLDMFLAGLPCTPHTDFRRKPCMTRDAVGLSPLTGASSGVSEDEAIEVLQRADGGLFFWHPRSRHFNSGMSLYCGTSGSGKSGALNRQRTALMAAGWRGVTLDFGGSSYRVCQAVGGNYIDITDARRTCGLGLFAIRPLPEEEYEPEELTDEGLPLDRLAEVENMIEVLCLDPTKPYETALAPALSSLLRKMVRKTYTELVDETPTINHFIRTLRRALKEDREKGDELASRLEIFAAHGSLGRFLNDRSEPISVNSPYTVFDFRAAANDPRLMLVASMAVRNFVSRLLKTSRNVPKFIDVDEFNVISRYPLICLSIDEAIRTARKLNALCSVASQDPSDFDTEAARGIRSNCEVRWLFAMPKPQLAGQLFELPPGVVRLISSLESQANSDYRDAVLVYPGGGCVHLRLRNGALDRRLLLGAGREVASLEEALADVEGPVDTRLGRALRADGLGVETRLDDVAVVSR